jgi:hypothetical protein
VYLQKRETMKECIGGGPVGESPMLKSDPCYLDSSISDKSVEVRKRVYLDLRSSLLYIGDSGFLAVYLHLIGFYALICNRLVIDLGPLIVFLTFLGGFKK